ncbi:related to Dihydrofolate reductase [Sporisorium reilianum f. sp. reilianum]|uniref:Dihydrofolate reductase n=1 Tax=Sporisorium reilianum f. sp. reilianum TaxID=72559 RepID=A0A2N8UGA2_9BASI|nr:related to Dihydrofolate reductase [Sporisorium reilianum f. sp. reilianum]
MGKLKLAMVAAMSLTNGIGKDGGLPWRLKGEMAYFCNVTSQVTEEDQRQGARNAVIMGRKTWASIPAKFRPLADRVNIVISRTSSAKDLGIDPDSSNVQVFSSVEQALTYLAAPQAKIGRVFVIGGAQLYTDLLKLDSSVARVDKLLVTRILAPRYECDAYFPEFRTQEQYKSEVEHAKRITADEKGEAEQLPDLLKQQEWTQASADSLRQYLGSACPAALSDSVEMVTSEGQTWYQYQLWERRD